MRQIARYREMIADGNPAELVAGQGEELWKTKRGPKNASLEKCDLGLGRRCRQRGIRPNCRAISRTPAGFRIWKRV